MICQINSILSQNVQCLTAIIQTYSVLYQKISTFQYPMATANCHPKLQQPIYSSADVNLLFDPLLVIVAKIWPQCHILKTLYYEDVQENELNNEERQKVKSCKMHRHCYKFSIHLGLHRLNDLLFQNTNK